MVIYGYIWLYMVILLYMIIYIYIMVICGCETEFVASTGSPIYSQKYPELPGSLLTTGHPNGTLSRSWLMDC